MTRKSAPADAQHDPSVAERANMPATAQMPASDDPMTPSAMLPDMIDISTDTDDVVGFLNMMKNCDHRFASKAHALRQKLEAEEKRTNNELVDLDAQRARVIMRHDETKADILLAISRVEKNRAGIARAIDTLEEPT